MIDKKKIETTLIEINPKIKKVIKKKNFNLIDNGFLDSLLIIRFIYKIESITKKKIKIGKIKRDSFSNLNKIYKILN
tara:strand:- start:333 stop:563 length:231 start_codon:yes stop_codon:yes gene_type:complete